MSRLAFWLILTKYAWRGSVEASGDGLHNGIWTYKHAQCRNERDNLEQPPEGEEDVAKHRKGLPICGWRLVRRWRPVPLSIARG